MSRLTIFSMILLVIIFLGLAACGGVKPTTDPSMFQTNAWQTVAVAQAQTALAASATPSSTYTPPVSETQQDTVTPLITNTPLPGAPTETVFSIKTATPRGTQSAACDNANFIKDVTIPDFAEVPAGSVVIKTWAFKNLGPCTWTVKYHLVFSYVSDSGKDGVFSPLHRFRSPMLCYPAKNWIFPSLLRLRQNRGPTRLCSFYKMKTALIFPW